MTSFSSLLPAGANTLRLPGPGGSAALAGTGTFDGIEVWALTEGMGSVERAMTAFAARLRGGGTLVLDVENSQSLRQLRAVLEGRPGAFDPAGSIEDPSQALPLRRVLQAAVAAGLHPVDVVRVPTPAAELGPQFAASVFREGFLPLDWLDGPPPWRFWLVGTKVRALGGSVLIGAGDAAAQARTEACVRAFLPRDWEVLRCAGERECAGWSAVIARARGELVWFLRAGATAGPPLFHELCLHAFVGPAAPGTGAVRSCPGDVSGLMLARTDVLLAGPLPRAPANTQVALEEYCMRLDACAAETQVAEGDFRSPPAPVEAPAVFAAEAKTLLDRWFPLTQGKKAHDSGDDPRVRSKAASPPWAGREPKISLCMIVRDEQHFLPECLQRARAAVDEIIVVDTGSTDGTIAIAESLGARVIRRPWDDDFSAPRNAALSAATGDWILVLDADEFLQPGAPERIRELVRDPGVAGYHMRFTNVYTGGKTVGVVMVRLFRNLPGIEYQNVIHEQVTPSLLRVGNELGLILSVCDVEVEHHGYADAVMDGRRKNERNERLFKKQLARHPDDIYSLYKYGDFLRRVAGRSRDARDLLERCLELILAGPPSLPRELPYAGEVAALCALEYAREEQPERARAIVDTALRRFVPTPNLHYLAASLALGAGANDAAIAHFRRCLAYRGQVLVVPIQDGITGHVALTGIAQAWLQKGDLARAERLLAHAIALQPAYEVSHLMLSRLHLQRGDAGAALRTLTSFLAVHPHSPGACQQTTLILQRLGFTEEARRMGERAVGLLRTGAADREAVRMEEILAAL